MRPPCRYMVKELNKSSSLEPKGRRPWNLVCCIKYSRATKFIQWPWVDTDLFYGNVKFASLAFNMGNRLNCRFRRNHWSQCNKSWYIESAKKYMTIYECQKSRSFSELCPRSLSFQQFSETTGPFKPNFIWSLHGMTEQNFVQMVQVIWPRWPPCPYKVKPFKNLLIWNQKVDDLETWYATLGTRVPPVCLNDDPGLTYFTASSNMHFFGFYIAKKKTNWTVDFSEIIEACVTKSNVYSQQNNYMTIYECQRSMSFIDLSPVSF